MTAPDILPPPIRGHLSSLKAAASSLQGAVLAHLASLEESLTAAYGEDAMGPMALGRPCKRILQALGDLSSEVANLEDEVEITAVEDERRCMQVEEERAA